MRWLVCLPQASPVLWRLILISVTILTLSSAGSARAEGVRPPRPMIFLHGNMGSQLCNEKGEPVWGVLLDLPNFLDLSPDSEAGKQLTPCGLLETFVVIPFLFEMTAYDGFVDKMESMGYAIETIKQKDENVERVPRRSDYGSGSPRLFICLYDWRKSALKEVNKFKNCLDIALSESADGKVDVVVHSFGGVILRVAINNFGIQGRFKNIVFVGTPHRGAAQVFYTGTRGVSRFLNIIGGGVVAFTDSAFRMASTYQQVPMKPLPDGVRDDGGACKAWVERGCCWAKDDGRENVFRKHEDAVCQRTANQVALRLDNINIWKNFEWMPDDIKDLPEFLKDAAKVSNIMEQPLVPTAGQNVTYIYGDKGAETNACVEFEPDGSIGRFIKGPGDGTVTVNSAMNEPDILADCKPTSSFLGLAPSSPYKIDENHRNRGLRRIGLLSSGEQQRVTGHQGIKADHIDIINEDKTIETIKNVVLTLPNKLSSAQKNFELKRRLGLKKCFQSETLAVLAKGRLKGIKYTAKGRNGKQVCFASYGIEAQKLVQAGCNMKVKLTFNHVIGAGKTTIMPSVKFIGRTKSEAVYAPGLAKFELIPDQAGGVVSIGNITQIPAPKQAGLYLMKLHLDESSDPLTSSVIQVIDRKGQSCKEFFFDGSGK